MNNKKFIIISVCILLLGFMSIFSLKYYVNKKDMIKVDGSIWGKPKIITNAGLNTDIAAEKYNENYIVAFNNDDSLEILLVNSEGETIKRTSNDLESQFINDINVNIYDDQIYVAYVINIGGEKSFNVLKLNRELEVLEEKKTEDVKRAINIKNEVYALVYEDRIEIRDDLKVYSSINEKVSTIDFIDEDGYEVLVYGNVEGEYKYIKLEDNFITEPKVICKTSIGQGVNYDHMSVAISEDNIYLTFQQNHKNVFQDSLYYKYSLIEDKFLKDGTLKIGSSKIKNVTYVGEDIFLGTIEEIKGMKVKKTSLVQIIFNDNMEVMIKEKIATYNRGYDYISKNGDYLFIGVYNTIGDYDVSMVGIANGEEDYEITSIENKLLSQSAGEGIAYAIGFSFIYLLISAVIYGMIFVGYSCLTMLSEGKKGVIGITVFLIILYIIKCYVITTRIMAMCYIYMPGRFTSFYLWIGLNAVISFVMWSIGIVDIMKSKKEINLIKIYALSMIDVFLSYTLIFTFVM